MAEAALRNDDLAEAEVECAPKVLELVLQACRGRVDACVGHYIALALDRRGRRPGRAGAAIAHGDGRRTLSCDDGRTCPGTAWCWHSC
jgi:hypothetical protein